jgi:murein DD-endopeptidase MepM/ murein hydrolase activator NlpD
VRVPNDLQRGDTVDLIVEERAGEEPLLDAVRFHSGKLAKTLAAYRYQATGDRVARFYQPDGEELELRLVDAPLDDYDQVTSLLRDGRGHKGVDFKTPVGTPVKAPFDGVISRRTWKFNLNGNSLELKESGGEHRTALFLHLSEASAEVGAQVKRGAVIGKSGNTGHSFAPHLHYQLMSASDQVLDPFQVQHTERRPLPDGDKARFAAEVKRLDVLLGPE